MNERGKEERKEERKEWNDATRIKVLGDFAAVSQEDVLYQPTRRCQPLTRLNFAPP